MELDWPRAQKGEEWWLYGGNGVATWREEKSGTTQNHMEKDSGKRIQAKEMVQLVGSQGRSARQG